MTKTSCQKWEILLGEYALQTIAPADRARVERHLGTCAACRASLEETRKLYEMLEPYDLPSPAPFFGAKVMGALRRADDVGFPETAARRWWRPAVFFPAGALAAAAVALVLFVKIQGMGGTVTSPIELTTPPAEAPAATATVATAREEQPAAGGAIHPRSAAEEHWRPAPGIARGEGRGAGMVAAATETRSADVGRSGGFGAGGRTATGGSGMMALKESEYRDAKKRAGSAEGAETEKVFEERDAADGHWSRMTPVARVDVAKAKSLAGGRVMLAGGGAAAAVPPEVAAWVDPRIEADVDALTGDDAALFEYAVGPNGTIMIYVSELPMDVQKEVLSRLKAEAASAPAAEILNAH